MNLLKYLFGVLLILISFSKDDEPLPTQSTSYTMEQYDGNATANFEILPYTVYYQKEFTEQTNVIDVSRGVIGLIDDIGQLVPYVETYVQKGYVVIQINHRFVMTDITIIAQYRGEEIEFIVGKVAIGNLNYGPFSGTIDGNKQRYIGHLSSCMEGLESACVNRAHCNYLVPQIKAVYGMSPAGNNPDQFGINSNGFNRVGTTAIFLIFGEQEKDENDPGSFRETDWRLQAYQGMNISGPRYQTYVKGVHTEH
jgi:hypothetical protein